jgi:radical SAM protein with 4Fe4S-binding SPASM domain
LGFLDQVPTDEIKVEFQGGEPLLRTDLLVAVRDFCRRRFSRAQFVVCTNLQILGPDQVAFLDSDDTFTSTSLDGAIADHDRHRTQDARRATTFFANLETAVDRFGGRVSALPTIDPNAPPDFDALIETFASFGLRSIYLRPVNYHGFARRSGMRAEDMAKWSAMHRTFIDKLVDHNYRTGEVIEEYYFSHCLRRVLRPGSDGHVDLRNPALLGTDYIVVDFDGRLYPTDEARMLSRIGHIDLSIGTAGTGIVGDKVAQLNATAANNFDPDCVHCAFQPYCGTDPIDDISRYRRVDMPRADTWFCQRHMDIFDRVVALIYSTDERERYSVARWAGLDSWPAELGPVLQ